MKLKVPQAWSVPSDERKNVVAALDMSAETAGRGFCPECKTQMESLDIADQPMWVCSSCRVTLPKADA